MSYKINDIKYFDDDDEALWILIWHGRSYFSISEDAFFKDLYFVKTKKEYHNPQNWELPIYKAKKKLHLSTEVPVGSIFNHRGELIYPINKENKELKKVYEYDVILDNKNGFRNDNGLSILFENTFYKKLDEKLFKKTPYFTTIIKKKNKAIDEEQIRSNDIIKFIIPCEVIVGYFFYSESIRKLLEIDFWDKFINIRVEDKIGKADCHSDDMKRIAIDNIFQYFFTEDGSGREALELLSSVFRINLLNQQEYYYTKLPLNALYKIKCQGFYIGNNKFIVSKIFDCEIVNESSFYKVDRAKVEELNDRRKAPSTDSTNTNPIDRVNNSQNHETSSPSNAESEIDELGNSNIEPEQQIDLEMKKHKALFDTEYKEKLVQKERYENINYIPGVPLDGTTLETEGTGDSTKKSVIKIPLDSEKSKTFRIIQGLINKLKLEGCLINPILLENQNPPFSLPKVENQFVKSIYIMEIVIGNAFYYFLDALKGNSIILLRYANPNKSFQKENDPILTNIIEYAIAKHSFSWSSLYKFQTLNKLYGIELFQPMDHKEKYKNDGDKDVFDLEGSVESLYERVYELRIRKDLQNKYFKD
jgi:hypothetical protein